MAAFVAIRLGLRFCRSLLDRLRFRMIAEPLFGHRDIHQIVVHFRERHRARVQQQKIARALRQIAGLFHALYPADAGDVPID